MEVVDNINTCLPGPLCLLTSLIFHPSLLYSDPWLSFYFFIVDTIFLKSVILSWFIILDTLSVSPPCTRVSIILYLQVAPKSVFPSPDLYSKLNIFVRLNPPSPQALQTQHVQKQSSLSASLLYSCTLTIDTPPPLTHLKI